MENKELLYNSVNYLNSIQFEINIELLDFLAKKVFIYFIIMMTYLNLKNYNKLLLLK
jgi:hypothetical protein